MQLLKMKCGYLKIRLTCCPGTNFTIGSNLTSDPTWHHTFCCLSLMDRWRKRRDKLLVSKSKFTSFISECVDLFTWRPAEKRIKLFIYVAPDCFK